jgi:hypothetical protein
MLNQKNLDRLNAGVSSAGSDDKEIATAKQIANIEFEAIDEDLVSCFEMGRWAERSRDLGNCLRFAAAFVRLSKPEFIEATRKLLSDEDGGIEAFFEAEAGFKNVADDCLAYADLLTAAHARLLVAGTTVNLESDEVRS